MSEATTVPPKLKALHERVMKQFDAMSAVAEHPETLAMQVPAVSGWSVLQHLDHMTMTDTLLVMAIEGALAKAPDPKVKRAGLKGKIVLLTGYIPRGKGQAPLPTLPKAATPEDLKKNIARARQFIEALGKKLDKIAACQTLSPHPLLGGFYPAEWLRFIDIHHHHHFKIVREIEAKAGS